MGCLLIVCMVLFCVYPAQLAAAAAAAEYRVTTTGREHGDDGIEQAGAGTR
ncbi:hypothetical protein PF003_g4964 [Phytophthora fragariae]|nr:hypothetical protein PF003_g4964 [Phytophthora fragariae]